MRRTIASVTTPSRWRRRRAARVAVAGVLVIAAPFVGHTGSADPAETAGHHDASGGAGSRPGPGEAPGSAAGGGVDGERGPLRVVPVPLADPAVADLLRPGDLVDLVATAAASQPADFPVAPGPDVEPGPEGGPDGREDGDHAPDPPPAAVPGTVPVLVAHAARVRDTPVGRSGSRSILVEVPEADAAHLASTAAGTPLAVVVHG